MITYPCPEQSINMRLTPQALTSWHVSWNIRMVPSVCHHCGALHGIEYSGIFRALATEEGDLYVLLLWMCTTGHFCVQRAISMHGIGEKIPQASAPFFISINSLKNGTIVQNFVSFFVVRLKIFEQAVVMPMIWDAMTLIWLEFNELHEPRIFYPSGHCSETTTNTHVSTYFR